MTKTTNASKKTSTKAASKWTQKREESLVRLFSRFSNKPNWSGKIAKQMHIFTANAIYKKAGRLGLISPGWVREERE